MAKFTIQVEDKTIEVVSNLNIGDAVAERGYVEVDFPMYVKDIVLITSVMEFDNPRLEYYLRWENGKIYGGVSEDKIVRIKKTDKPNFNKTGNIWKVIE